MSFALASNDFPPVTELIEKPETIARPMPVQIKMFMAAHLFSPLKLAAPNLPIVMRPPMSRQMTTNSAATICSTKPTTRHLRFGLRVALEDPE